MTICSIECDQCHFCLDVGIGSSTSVIDNNGDRIEALHPGEMSTIRIVLGWNLTLDEINARTGLIQAWFCQSCLETCHLDFQADPDQCTHGGPTEGKPVKDMIKQPCPKCDHGVIKAVDTGMTA